MKKIIATALLATILVLSPLSLTLEYFPIDMYKTCNGPTWPGDEPN